MSSIKIKRGPGPELPFTGERSGLSQQRARERVLRIRLAKIQQRLMLLGWFTAGTYAMLLIGMAAIVWNRGRLENASKPLLIHKCHVENVAKACAEIQRRTDLRP